MEEDIVEERTREQLKHALDTSIGALDLTHYPDWSTPEKVSAWVRASRKFDDESLGKKLSKVRLANLDS